LLSYSCLPANPAPQPWQIFLGRRYGVKDEDEEEDLERVYYAHMKKKPCLHQI
jgi:hypothetical protein